MNPVLLIPARMASTRLPDKPLADIGGVWDVVEVTRAISNFADAAISSALSFLLRREAEAQARIAHQRAYAADLSLAQQALAANNLGAD